jgi:iron only hydrogenase large subunit-like protein
LEIRGKGINQEIVPTKNKKIECILCGQCALHCPVSSAQEQAQWQEVEKAIKENLNQNKGKRKVIVALLAPYVRISLCEDFKLNYGDLKIGQLAAALKLLGFNFIFDLGLSLAAVATQQHREIIRAGKKPLFSSCCPAWVKYLKFYHPELTVHLSAVKSPHIMSGELIKTRWAEKNNINPKDVILVSISPCTAKKFEADRREARMNGRQTIDFALTTREVAWLIKKNNVKPEELKNVKLDKIGEEKISDYPGSGQIQLGFASPKKQRDYFTAEGILSFEIKIKNKNYRFGFVKGIKTVQDNLAELNEFDYVEVLACPGGCIGGGGEPIPTTKALIKARAAALLKAMKKK